jgi:Spy/CpxP family protein refolding chaperone
MRHKILPVIIAGILILLINFSSIAGKEKSDEESKRQFWRIYYWAEKDLFDARILLHRKDKIGLKAEQQRKAENMLLAYEESTLKESAGIKVLELKFASYLESEDVDRKEIETLINEISKRKTECIIKYLNYLLDLQEILSAGQKKKLKEIHQKVRQEIKKKESESKRPFPPN